MRNHLLGTLFLLLTITSIGDPRTLDSSPKGSVYYLHKRGTKYCKYFGKLIELAGRYDVRNWLGLCMYDTYHKQGDSGKVYNLLRKSQFLERIQVKMCKFFFTPLRNS